MFYYTYVLKSKVDDKLYVGWTVDLRRRLEQHNKGLVEATKYRRPLELIYYEACLTEKKAIKREKSLKTGFGRSYLKRDCKFGEWCNGNTLAFGASYSWFESMLPNQKKS